MTPNNGQARRRGIRRSVRESNRVQAACDAEPDHKRQARLPAESAGETRSRFAQRHLIERLRLVEDGSNRRETEAEHE